MSNLVYIGAFGEHHASMAKVLVASIRLGGYRESILIFTDSVRDFGEAEIYVVPENSPVLANIRGTKKYLRNGNWSMDYNKLRMSPDLLVDLSKYDTLLYADCDMLATDDITPLFDIPTDSISATTRTYMSLKAGCYGYYDLLPPERQEIAKKKKKIVAGAFIVHTADALPLFKEWRELYDSYGIDIKVNIRETHLEEILLNYLFALGRFELVSDKRMGLRARRDYKILYHFYGGEGISKPMQSALWKEISRKKQS